MIRILLDECLPVKLMYRFEEINSNFQVSTVTGMNWTGIKNGTLLEKAQTDFDVFITIDQNLSYQQELSKYSIAVITGDILHQSISITSDAFFLAQTLIYKILVLNNLICVRVLQ